ncbi:MAG: 50S ribosomal protein L21e, partial [Desulfurococcales archaeon]|nr:50S ribosomal protein L21e [Desulfurococcales archaeon]
GFRHKTRKLLKKHTREKGSVPPISLLLHDYNEGDKVHIIINPAIHKGMPHRRYHGKTGVVLGRRGLAYLVKTSLGKKEKILIIRPEHLRPAKG